MANQRIPDQPTQPPPERIRGAENRSQADGNAATGSYR